MKNSIKYLSKIISLVVLTVMLGQMINPTGTAAAQTTSPQDTARGLSTSTNSKKSTAGLNYTVALQDWPNLILQGGVKHGGYQALMGPTGIQLGKIKIPGAASASLVSEDLNWSANKMTLQYGGGTQFSVTASRLTPSLLVNTSAQAVQFFAGSVTRASIGADVNDLAEGPGKPKYVAYSSGGSIKVEALSATTKTLTMDQSWLLVWYGNNSHFVDALIPLSYTGYIGLPTAFPASFGFLADAPQLMVFSSKPSSIKQAAEGGIELAFSQAAGNIVVTPLYGRKNLQASATEAWASGLPAETQQKVQQWVKYSCSYPLKASETYAYNASADAAVITETFTFADVCAGGVRLAPIPPMLSIASNKLGVTFSKTVKDTGLVTEFGPYRGVENDTTYSWTLAGAKKYAGAKRIQTTGSAVPSELQSALDGEVNKIIAAGHLAPWIFADKVPTSSNAGDIYWLNPADSLRQLIDAAEALPAGDVKTRFTAYIRAERAAYPPETVTNLALDQGTQRGPFSLTSTNARNQWTSSRADVFLKFVPLYNFYSLARYYEFTGDAVPAAVMQKATTALNHDLAEQDWATFAWFSGSGDRKISVVNANRYYAGLVGYARLAKLSGDPSAEQLGLALWAKAAVSRAAMSLYMEYQASAGLMQLPSLPNWQVKYSTLNWLGFLYNNDWLNVSQDARQVVTLDQFGVRLFDHSGIMDLNTDWTDYYPGPVSAHLVGYKNLTPELYYFLSAFTQPQIDNYRRKVEEYIPNWYAAFSEAVFGIEHNLNHPGDSFEIFLLNAYSGAVPTAQLENYIDISWLQSGDLFYLNKLSETVNLYRGLSWSPTIQLAVIPGANSVALKWDLPSGLPANSTWRIEYTGPSGSPSSPVSGLDASLRAYTINNLNKGTTYSVKVSLVVDNQIVVSSRDVAFMPTNNKVFAPGIRK